MHKAIPALLTTAITIIPAGGVFAAGHAATTKPVATRTFQGPSVDMQWGPVRVTIIVTGKHLANIKVSAPTERARSAYINGIAVPMLVKEVLKAQVANIHHIYGVSGATMTSDAFYTSLLAALKTAHLM